MDTAQANVVTVGSYEALYLGLCVIHNYVINTIFFIYIYDYEEKQSNTRKSIFCNCCSFRIKNALIFNVQLYNAVSCRDHRYGTLCIAVISLLEIALLTFKDL